MARGGTGNLRGRLSRADLPAQGHDAGAPAVRGVAERRAVGRGYRAGRVRGVPARAPDAGHATGDGRPRVRGPRLARGLRPRAARRSAPGCVSGWSRGASCRGATGRTACRGRDARYGAGAVHRVQGALPGGRLPVRGRSLRSLGLWRDRSGPPAGSRRPRQESVADRGRQSVADRQNHPWGAGHPPHALGMAPRAPVVVSVAHAGPRRRSGASSRRWASWNAGTSSARREEGSGRPAPAAKRYHGRRPFDAWRQR